MDDKVRKLDRSEEFYFERAEDRFERGDYFGALKLLNQRAELFDPSADTCALYADTYEALGLYKMCVNNWYAFLDTCNEADFAEGYEGLANAYLFLGEEDRSNALFKKFMEAEFGEEGAEGVPHLRLVHSADGDVGEEIMEEGVECLREGDLDGARERFSKVPATSASFSSASGLSAMCLLLGGDVKGAAEECENLISHQPENVQGLTTYCAVLGAMGEHDKAREVGKRLASIETDSPEELFRIATALCETGLDEEAYQKLKILKERIPYGEEVLYFFAVAAYKTGRGEEAIEALELMTLLYPRKAIAQYYLERLRRVRESGEEVPLGYFYKLPDPEREFILKFFRHILSISEDEAKKLGSLPSAFDYCRMAVDQLDGRDEEMQTLALRAAVKGRIDKFVREILLDPDFALKAKIDLLKELTCRDEENSFGVVACNVYREFFTHEFELFGKSEQVFMSAFAEVYARYYLVCNDLEDKIYNAAEEVYDSIAMRERRDLLEDENALSAAIYREARISDERRPIEEVASYFEADVSIVKQIIECIVT